MTVGLARRPTSDVSCLVTFINIIEPRDILEAALDQIQGISRRVLEPDSESRKTHDRTATSQDLLAFGPAVGGYTYAGGPLRCATCNHGWFDWVAR